MFILFLLFAFYQHSFSQCDNSVKVIKTYSYKDNNSANRGAIQVSIKSSGQFLCKLIIEKGSGPEQIQQKQGHNNSDILFEDLDLDNMYQVQVEFFTEKEQLCSNLQRSGIIIEAE